MDFEEQIRELTETFQIREAYIRYKYRYVIWFQDTIEYITNNIVHFSASIISKCSQKQ